MNDPNLVADLCAALRDSADRLELDPESLTSPSPHAITCRTCDGALVRLDISTYTKTELAL